MPFPTSSVVNTMMSSADYGSTTSSSVGNYNNYYNFFHFQHHHPSFIVMLLVWMIFFSLGLVYLSSSSSKARGMAGVGGTSTSSSSSFAVADAWSRRLIFFNKKGNRMSERDRVDDKHGDCNNRRKNKRKRHGFFFPVSSTTNRSWRLRKTQSHHDKDSKHATKRADDDDDDATASSTAMDVDDCGTATNLYNNNNNNSRTIAARVDTSNTTGMIPAAILQLLQMPSSLASSSESTEEIHRNKSNETFQKEKLSVATGPKKWFFWDDLTFASPFSLLRSTSLSTASNDDNNDEDDYDSDDNYWSELENDEEFYYSEIVPVSSSFTTSGSVSTAATSIMKEVFGSGAPTTTYYYHPPPSITMSSSLVPTTTVTHFCFLMHGHRGLSRDLSYMQSVMRKQARIRQHKLWSEYVQKQKQKQQQPPQNLQHDKQGDDKHQDQQQNNVGDDTNNLSSLVNNENSSMEVDGQQNNSTSTISTSNNDDIDEPFIWHDFVVHSVTSNEKRTDDGVRAGGERIVDEIIEFIRLYMANKKSMLKKQQLRKNRRSRLKRQRSQQVFNTQMDDCNQDQKKTFSSTEHSYSTDEIDVVGVDSTEAEPLGELHETIFGDGDDNDSDEVMDVTISLLGNSLGGLYARYVVSKLSERLTVLETMVSSNETMTSTTMILDNKYKIHWNVFCTTATPHLGLSGHTYVPLPRTAEYGVASALGETGRDLFRFNPLLHEMATDPAFISPLGQFRHRIAYANAYGTDFPVPVSTAAFLSESSTYPHHFVEDNERIETSSAGMDLVEKNDMDVQTTTVGGGQGGTSLLENDHDGSFSNGDNDLTNYANSPATVSNGLVVATLHTPPIHELSKSSAHYLDHVVNSTNHSNRDGSFVNDENDSEQELARMSTSLDSLGWKKVFVDVRKEIPRISISKSLLNSVRAKTSKNTSARVPGNTEGNTKDGTSDENLDASSSSSCDDDVASTNISAPTSSESFVRDIANKLSTSLLAVNPSLAAMKNTVDSLSSSSKCIQQLKRQGGVLASKDVIAAVLPTTPLLSANSDEISLHWPLGHNMIVAFSRSRWSSYMNKAGRPVVDTLAKEIVDNIFTYHPCSADTTLE